MTNTSVFFLASQLCFKWVPTSQGPACWISSGIQNQFSMSFPELQGESFISMWDHSIRDNELWLVEWTSPGCPYNDERKQNWCLHMSRAWASLNYSRAEFEWSCKGSSPSFLWEENRKIERKVYGLFYWLSTMSLKNSKHITHYWAFTEIDIQWDIDNLGSQKHAKCGHQYSDLPVSTK